MAAVCHAGARRMRLVTGTFVCWLAALLPWTQVSPPKSTARRLHYTDTTARSGISYISRNGFTGRKYFPQPMCGGVAILDFDGDGLMDIFFTNGGEFPGLKKSDPGFYNRLYRNKGDGTFEDVTARAGLTGSELGVSYGVAAGDYDNDGYPDLFIANAGRNALYHNNGDGTFSDVSQFAGLAKPADTLSVQGAWFDFDNDGLLDLAVSNYTVWTPEKDRRCVTNGVESYCHPNTYSNVPQRLYHNLGKGRFEDVTEASGFGSAEGKGMGIGIADFNGDGLMDVFIANDTERNLLFMNAGRGKFKEVGLTYGAAYNEDGNPVSAMGADAKDYNNDGFVDIVYNDLMTQGWGLFRNHAGKSFEYTAPESKLGRLSQAYSGWSLAFVDYDNDGFQDLYSANGDVDNLSPDSRQHDTMFKNVDGARFVDVSGEMGPDFLRVGYQRGAAVGDLNNDGFMDLVVTSLNEKPRILINSADNGFHWLTVQPVGHKSNRDGVGATLRLTTQSGRVLTSHVTASVGFLSSSDRRVHFGLAGERLISKLEIRWPCGAVQELHNIKADQILKVDEPR